MSDENFLSRWSRRKTEAKSVEPAPEAPVVPAPQPSSSVEAAPEPLPPLESLTPESDFTPFMKPDVDAGTRREALKTLFRDPQFNVMDGLDVYIDDYSKPDPLPEGWLDRMYQVARLGEYLDPEKEALRKQQLADAAARTPEKATEEQPLVENPEEPEAIRPPAPIPPSEI